MVKFLRKRERVQTDFYQHNFRYIDPAFSEAGYGFDCDVDGNIVHEDWDTGKIGGFEDMPELAQLNLMDCFSEENPLQVEYKGIEHRVHSYMQHAIIECERCGAEVHLDDMSDNDYNECDGCGQGYNFFGQMVNGGLRDIDESYAGERWDDEY